MKRRSWGQLLANTVIYALSVLACMYLVQFGASETAKAIYWLRFPFSQVRSADLSRFYTGNWLVFNLVAGGMCGSAAYSIWRNTASLFVWVPSFCVLCYKIFAYPHSVLAVSSPGSKVLYFLSSGCEEISDFYISQRCTEQFEYSLPFYAAVGFSAGAALAILYKRRGLSRGSLCAESSHDPTETIDKHYQPPENHRTSAK